MLSEWIYNNQWFDPLIPIIRGLVSAWKQLKLLNRILQQKDRAVSAKMSLSGTLEATSLKVFLIGATDALPCWFNLFKEVRDQETFTNLSRPGFGNLWAWKRPWSFKLLKMCHHNSTETRREKQTKNISFFYLSDYLIQKKLICHL